MVYIFASESAEQASEGGISALGLDLKAFIFQLISFAIIVFFLNKFVFSKVFKVIDERKQEIEAGLERSNLATKELEKAGDKAEQLLKEARAEADNLLHSAHEDASALLKSTEEKAALKAEKIVSEAKEQLKVEVDKAKVELKKENAKLVAKVTEEIIGEKLTDQKDQDLIKKALK
jgi:F-type H+-transporting ATPase subunit b